MLAPRLFAVLLVLVSVLAVAPPPAGAAEMNLFQEPDIVRDIVKGDYDEVRRELVGGVSALSSDNSRQPLLVVAARAGHPRIIDLLIQYGARPDTRDPLGNTPLIWAASNGDETSIRHLLEAGANVNAGDAQGQTPLIRAVRAGRPSAVKTLLDAGADPLIADYTGRDALFWAESSRSSAVRRLVAQAAR